jgi:hypothetical protein
LTTPLTPGTPEPGNHCGSHWATRTLPRNGSVHSDARGAQREEDDWDIADQTVVRAGHERAAFPAPKAKEK